MRLTIRLLVATAGSVAVAGLIVGCRPDAPAQPSPTPSTEVSVIPRPAPASPSPIETRLPQDVGR